MLETEDIRYFISGIMKYSCLSNIALRRIFTMEMRRMEPQGAEI